ncbi:O-antigen ligase family protein [Microbacterium sp. M1A1_1b]
MTEVLPKPRIPVALGIAMMFIIVQDTLNTIFKVQGEVTIAVAGVLGLVGIATLASSRSALSTRAVPLPMQLFVIWAAVRFGMAPSVIGLQNLLVWFIFPATIAVVYARTESGTFERAYPWWKWLAVASAALYLIEVVRDGIGAGTFPYSARGAGWLSVLALVLVVPVTVAARSSWVPTVMLVLVIALSLSRTPLAIAAILLIIVIALRPFKKQRPGGARIVLRLFLMTTVVAAGAYVLITHVAAIRDRFIDGDGYSIGGIEINSSGRSVLWGMTIEQWQQSPWIGHGPGAAQTLISNRFPGWIAHPHNEYLRILDDTGIVGMTLWGLGMLMLLARAVRAVLQAENIQVRALHIGAALSVIVILLGSITDNLTISVYAVMIAGSAIGLSAANTKTPRSQGTEPLSSRPIRYYSTPPLS